MSIASGTALGPYQILSPIGAGGMGEVYRARDTRLDRTVAIKVLPEHLSRNLERRRRFEREARAVSSLNHPHICTLYEFDSEGEIDFIVMEYIEGESLADRLTRGALPLTHALDCAAQIADAIDKAHRHGVIHRDLKPGNIMLTKPGVKLLDFGLAKLQDDREETPESEDATRQRPLTDAGAVLGTVQYMSPEQLEAKEADARSDIFAFGAVLYEMITGRRAFEGSSKASLITAILSADPPPMSELQSTSPRALDRVVKKCLAKDPEDRWQSAHDLADELMWIAGEGTGRDAAEPSESGHEARAGGSRVAIALLLAAAASVSTWFLTRTEPRSPARLSVTLPAGHALVTQNGPPPFAISPDGTKLVYAARLGGASQLYIRDLDSFESRPIAGTEGGHSPFFSPDGQSVGFFTPNLLEKVALPDGTPVVITAGTGANSTGATWGPDDIIVYVPRRPGTLMRVSARGGTPEPVNTERRAGELYGYPQILPDGDDVLFTIDSEGRSVLAIASIATGEVRRLEDLGEASGGRYISTGHLVYGASGSLLAVPFAVESQEVQGTPISLLEGVRTDFGAPAFAVSKNGTLVYAVGGQSSRSLLWVDRDGRATSPILNGPEFHFARLSPDGGRVGYSFNNDLWVHDIGRGTHTRLVPGGNFPVWSPDGARIAFIKSGEIFAVPSDGSGEPEPMLARAEIQRPMSWSPDGRFLATDVDPESHQDIWVLPLGGEPSPFLVTPFREGAAKFSPDGRWLAYVSDESGRNEVYVQAFPGPGQKVTVSTEGGAEPVWSPAGGELFYRRGSDMMVVDVTTDPTFRAGRPRPLFSGDYRVDGAGHPSYDVSRDGQRFLMVQDVREEALTEIRVVLDWHEELERLVPADP